MNCPKCGSGEIARYGKRVHFQCGSYGIGGTVDGSFYTHDHCADIREIADLKYQRDALQARVKQLEELLGVSESAKTECIFGKESKP